MDHQTGGPQPERVSMRIILTVLASHGNEDAGAVRKTVEKVVADERLRYDENE